jgi:branched-chain amino acid transport system ATP-binding protein
MLLVEELTVRYGAIEAVRSASLRIDEGEIVALIGPNGAGKTTFLSAIVGLVETAGGRVALDGDDITGLRTEAIVRGGVGLVPEHRRLFADLTVRENLQLGAATRRDRAGIAQDIERMCARFSILGSRMDQQAGLMSGGEAQQLAIARALISRPRLLLLDEPSLGLAPIIVDEVFALLAELRAEGHTMLLVEQNAYQALELADRMYVMRSGELAGGEPVDGAPDEEALLEAYLGSAPVGGP